MVEHRRMQIDARRWMLGKMAPKSTATAWTWSTPEP